MPTTRPVPLPVSETRFRRTSMPRTSRLGSLGRALPPLSRPNVFQTWRSPFVPSVVYVLLLV